MDTHMEGIYGKKDPGAESDLKRACSALRRKDNGEVANPTSVSGGFPPVSRQAIRAAIFYITGYKLTRRSRASPAGQRQAPWLRQKSGAPNHPNTRQSSDSADDSQIYGSFSLVCTVSRDPGFLSSLLPSVVTSTNGVTRRSCR